MSRILIRHQSEQDALINNGSRRRLSFDPTDPPSGEIVIDYQLPTALRGATATRLPSPSSFSSSLASTTKRKFEETEEKEIAESYHKREMLVKGTRAPTPAVRSSSLLNQ
jgi:alpha-beta hydrolase superfamily lysophospholipase